MNFLYKAKWIIMVLSAIVWVMTFGVLFVGGTAFVNRTFLVLNLILLLARIAMVGYNNIAIVGYIYLGLELYCQGINNRI